MNSNYVGSSAGSPAPGSVILSVKMHPVYEAIAEVRLMENGLYRIFHHYGDGSIPWPDEVAEPTNLLDEAIETIRGYHRVFTSNRNLAVAA